MSSAIVLSQDDMHSNVENELNNNTDSDNEIDDINEYNNFNHINSCNEYNYNIIFSKNGDLEENNIFKPLLTTDCNINSEHSILEPRRSRRLSTSIVNEIVNENSSKINDILKLNSIEELIKIGILFPNDIEFFNVDNDNNISSNDDEINVLIRKTVRLLLIIIYILNYF